MLLSDVHDLDVNVLLININFVIITISDAPCGLRGCKNRPVPFYGRMSDKASKPGLVLFYILACFNCCIVAY